MKVNLGVRQPSDDLRSLVSCYQWYEVEGTQTAVIPIPAKISCDVVFQFGEPVAWRRRDASTFRQFPQTFLVTPSRSATELRIPRRTRAFRVVLKAFVAGALFKQSASSISNMVFDFERLSFADDLAARILEAGSREDAVNLFEDWIRTFFADLRAVAARMEQSICLLMAGERVAGVAARESVSTRQLERRFLETIGVQPKFYQRVARLNAVIHEMYGDQNPDWAAMAATHGFTDQAHLVREFRSLTGQSPATFRQGDGFNKLLLKGTSETVSDLSGSPFPAAKSTSASLPVLRYGS